MVFTPKPSSWLGFHTQILSIAYLLPRTVARDFNRQACLQDTRFQLQQNQSMALDPALFFFIPASNSSPILTLNGCYALCSDHASPYADIGPRLTTWLIPAVFLLVNLQFAPIGKGRFFSVVHLLGDPIDSMFSLLSKVEVWNRCFSRAGELHLRYPRRVPLPRENQVKNLAIIFSTLEETMGPLNISDDPVRLFINLFGEHALHRSDFEVLSWRCAGELVDVRIKEMRRTWLSIFLYLFQVIAAFVPEIGGEPSSPPGGRIAFAMLLSSLLPNVLLSNIIGDFVNRRECLRILIRFQKSLEAPEGFIAGPERLRGHASLEGLEGALEAFPEGRRLTRDTSLQDRLHDDEYFSSLAWSGGIYSYRPGKYLFKGGAHDNHPHHLAFISCLPVVTSSFVAFLILWHSSPKGYTCRHFVIVATFLVWCISPAITWFITHRKRLSDKSKWYWVIGKDFVFAIPILALIFGSSCGLFNGCYCFSGVFMYGLKGARVALDTDSWYLHNYHTFYPVMVSVCLGLQTFGIPGWVWLIGRPGLRIMRWTEEDRMAAPRALYPEELEEVTQRSSSQFPLMPHEARHRQDSDAPLLGEFNLPLSPGHEMNILNRR